MKANAAPGTAKRRAASSKRGDPVAHPYRTSPDTDTARVRPLPRRAEHRTTPSSCVPWRARLWPPRRTAPGGHTGHRQPHRPRDHCHPTACTIAVLVLAAIAMDAALRLRWRFLDQPRLSLLLLPSLAILPPPLFAAAFRPPLVVLALWLCWRWSRRAALSRADPLHALPLEVAAHVASFWSEDNVAAARRVSRRWRSVGTTDVLRRKHDRNIEFKEYEAGKPPRLVRDLGNARSVDAVAVAPDGTVFASDWGHRLGDGKIQVYDDYHRHLQTIDSGYVDSLCVRPGRDEIYAGSSDGEIHVWAFNGTLVRKLGVGHFSLVLCLAFGQDGDLYLGSLDGGIRVWGAEGRHIRSWQAHQGDVNCLAECPQSPSVWYSGGDDNIVKKWDAGGRCLQIFDGHTGPVLAIVVSTCGGKIYSGSVDGSIRVWSPDGDHLQTLHGHTERVRCLAFSPDGRLYSGSDDRTIRAWDRDGKLLRTLRGHVGGVTSLAFNPDGSKLYSGSWDGTVKVW